MFASEEDLRHAYYQIPLNKAFRHFVCIETAKHGVLQFTRAAMGMMWSSFILYRMLQATLSALPPSVPVLPYADNVPTFGATYQEALAHLNLVTAVLHQHGWVTNSAKRRLPFQEGPLLGVDFNFPDQTTQPTLETRTTILSCIEKFTASPSRLGLEVLQGHVTWAATADPEYFGFTHQSVHTLNGRQVQDSPAPQNEFKRLRHHVLTALPAPMPAPPRRVADHQHVYYSR
jgi:hypothetical protein